MVNNAESNIFVVPVGYSVFTFGLVSVALSVLRVVLPMDIGMLLSLAFIIGGGIGFWRWMQIANTIHNVWYWEQQAYAEKKRFETEAYKAGGGVDEETKDGDTVESTEAITVNELAGSYRLPRLTSQEQELQDEIGQCLRFIAIAQRSEGKLTMREMFKRVPGTRKSDFEKWWTLRTNKLYEWGFIEKGEKQTTCLRGTLTLGQVRAALLRRDFPSQKA